MDKTPKYNTLRPYSMTVHLVAEMLIATELGESHGSLNVKMPIEQAQELYDLLGRKLKNKTHGFVSFNISGPLK